jgi:hypothetical protein
LGVFQIGGVKALRKSPVDIAKSCPNLVTPILTCENAGKTCCRPQLEGSSTLKASDVEGSPEAGLGFLCGLLVPQS